jgi:hypothetical protein
MSSKNWEAIRKKTQLQEAYNEGCAMGILHPELQSECPYQEGTEEHTTWMHGYNSTNGKQGYRDYLPKIEIDSHHKLLEFILENYSSVAPKTLGLVPIYKIFIHTQMRANNYTKEDFILHLNQLRLTHKLQLVTTKSQLAKNFGIELVEISGIKYGFVRILM